MEYLSQESLYFFIVFMIPFILIVILPFLISYIKGEKDLKRAVNTYIKSLRKIQKTVLSNKLADHKLLRSKLSINYTIKITEPPSTINAEISLIERRTYVYYLYRLFKPLPDILIIRANLEAPSPVVPVYIIPRHRKKLINKLMPYLAELKEIRIKGLSEKAIIVSSEPRYAVQYFTQKTLTKISFLLPHLNFLFIDSAAPNIEINTSLQEKTCSSIFNISFTLCLELLDRIAKSKKGGKETDTLKYLRRVLLSL
ncbi:MAG: hypothetical protein ACTSX9_06265 [Candidatus Njordarchaeales archaeon]